MSRLVGACADGDAAAWRELVHRYRRLVYSIPLMLGLQPADADDIFQQTFAELLRYLPRLRDPERIDAWLMTTARRASIRLLRSERRRHAQAANEAPVDVRAHEEEFERLQLEERMRRALETIGEPCRTLLLGMFSDPPTPYQALARQLGLAMGSLGPTRGRCLQRLRRAMRKALEAIEVRPRSQEGTRS